MEQNPHTIDGVEYGELIAAGLKNPKRGAPDEQFETALHPKIAAVLARSREKDVVVRSLSQGYPPRTLIAGRTRFGLIHEVKTGVDGSPEDLYHLIMWGTEKITGRRVRTSVSSKEPGSFADITLVGQPELTALAPKAPTVVRRSLASVAA